MADQIPVQKMYPVQYLVGSLLLGLIIGVLISSLWSFSEKDTASSKNLTEATEKNTTALETPEVQTQPSAVSKNDILVIEDQPAGLSVIVAHVNVENENWVVIHEDRMGLPGNALGAARFVDGTTSGTIELLRGTSPGQYYHGLVYKDDGDKIFSVERDIPLRDESGNPIASKFKTN